MEGCGNEDDASAGRGVGAIVGMFLGGGEEVRDGRFQCVEGADGVDVEDGFEGIGGEAVDGRQEVARCTGTGGMLALVS